MINGHTKKVGVIGRPVGHSLSPLMHNAAFRAAGLNYIYVPLPVEPNQLREAVSGLKALGFSGANITIPHKVNVIQFLDDIDRIAAMIGAVNTIVVRDGRLIGYNTDAEGFIASLMAEHVNVAGTTAVLTGAGGAARAIVSGLIANGVKKIWITARDKGKAAQLAASFSTLADMDSCNFDDKTYRAASSAADILINCTPLGMAPRTEAMPPIEWGCLNPAAVLCDLIYNPSQTQLLNAAQQRGHKIVGGMGMLIEQGAIAFQLWTGLNAPRAVMREAISSRLC
jgi:shikimate dehydrogenase